MRQSIYCQELKGIITTQQQETALCDYKDEFLFDEDTTFSFLDFYSNWQLEGNYYSDITSDLIEKVESLDFKKHNY